jgi:hypothetical protein
LFFVFFRFCLFPFSLFPFFRFVFSCSQVPAAAHQGGGGEGHPGQGGDHYRGAADADAEAVLQGRARAQHRLPLPGRQGLQRPLAHEHRHGAAQVLQPPVRVLRARACVIVLLFCCCPCYFSLEACQCLN